VPRPDHKDKEFENEFRKMERAGWTVDGGGNRHFKLKCPNDCKCMIVVSTTPGGRNPLRTFVAQRTRATCWKED
jgi:hypothetical protein